MRDRKSTRLNSSHTVIYTLSLHDALPILPAHRAAFHAQLSDAYPLSLQSMKVQVSVCSHARDERSEEHTSELQSHSDLHSFPTRRSSDLARTPGRISCAVIGCISPIPPKHESSSFRVLTRPG